jgi:hypothetical protein
MFAAAAVAALSCGSSPQMMMDVPVKQQPLAGKINGQPWSAVSATASAMKAFTAGERWIDVYDTQIDCSVFSPNPDSEIIGTVPWQVTNYNLGFGGMSKTLTLVYHDDGGMVINEIITDGRVEVVSAPDPDAGTPALIRIRADQNENFDVEGEIHVQVCD